jgi:hypothetical protein
MVVAATRFYAGEPLSSGLMAAVRRLGGGGLDVGREMGELVCR